MRHDRPDRLARREEVLAARTRSVRAQRTVRLRVTVARAVQERRELAGARG